MGEWTGQWPEIVERVLEPATARLYRGHLRYLEPLSGLGLRQLTAEDLEHQYSQLTGRGLSTQTVASVHRTIRSCFNEAVRRGHLDRNPALVARPPRAEARQIDPLSLDETRSVIDASRRRRNGVRWQLALAVGLRQGEALGLQWDDLDLDAGTVRVRRTLSRAPWKHGCPSPGCGQRAWRCPRRHGGGLVVGTLKTNAGTRIVALPDRIASYLAAHRQAQVAAGADWQPPPPRDRLHTGSGWVFATPSGAAIDPSRDWKDWKQLLSEAKVADYRVHDARHSAATFIPSRNRDPHRHGHPRLGPASHARPLPARPRSPPPPSRRTHRPASLVGDVGLLGRLGT